MKTFAKRIISKFVVISLVLGLTYSGSAWASLPGESSGENPAETVGGSGENPAETAEGSGENPAETVEGSGENPAETAGGSGENPAETSDPEKADVYQDDEVIVIMEENREVSDLNLQPNDEIIESIPLSEQIAVTVSVEGTEEERQEKIEEYERNPDVRMVQNNYLYESLEEVDLSAAAAVTNDPLSGDQWYLDSACRFPQAWAQINSQNKVKVAIIDSGVKIDHEDLKDNINQSKAFDFASNSSALKDVSGHGTHVAGIIGGVAGNQTGIAGVSNNNIEMLCYGVFTYDNVRKKYLASTTEVHKAYQQAVKDGAKIINLSMGGYLPVSAKPADYVLNDAIAQAYKKGVITVCAGGNDNETRYLFPSDMEEVISVVAVNQQYEKAPFSDHNQYKDIAAPGMAMLSTSSDGDYEWMQGTSMAAPVVSGVVALMLAANPKLTVHDIKRILFLTATDLGAPGWDEYTGWGLINAELCVKEAKQMGSTMTGISKNATVESSVAQSKLFETNSLMNVTGRNRTETSLLLAEKVKRAFGGNQFQTMILASGQTFPDGLGGSPLSILLRAPIIIYTPGEEEAIEKYFFTNLALKGEVIILGGNGVVPTRFENKIREFAAVKRLGGQGRYDTNLKTLEEAVKNGIAKDEIIIVSGNDSADALSASAAGKAIMIVNKNLSPAQTQFLKTEKFSKITILGGTGAVSETVANEVNKATGKTAARIGGKGRIETSHMTANKYFPSAGCRVYTKADGFADGLSGGLLANTLGAPMMLTFKPSDRLSGGRKVYIGGVR